MSEHVADPDNFMLGYNSIANRTWLISALYIIYS